jgi:hypothetical protein
MTNQDILQNSFKKHNCENIIGTDGRLYTAILEAMELAATNVNVETVMEKLHAKDYLRIPKLNPLNTIVDECGLRVNESFLNEMFDLCSSKEDFLKKVNLGITNEKSSISYINDKLILIWFDKRYNNAPAPSPKGRYYKGEQTLKSQALDWVQLNGPKTSTEIKKFMYEISNPGKTYNTFENRGWYCSYFYDAMSWSATHRRKAQFNKTSPNDNRILFKLANGKYSAFNQDTMA